jgi:hypothetical protein
MNACCVYIKRAAAAVTMTIIGYNKAAIASHSC